VRQFTLLLLICPLGAGKAQKLVCAGDSNMANMGSGLEFRIPTWDRSRIKRFCDREYGVRSSF
jgi:hypothetical protein